MKKISALLLAGIFVVMCLCSCSGTTDGKQAYFDNNGEEIMEYTPDKAPEMSVPDTEVAVGDVFSVFINLENPGWNWDSFEIVVSYDQSIIKINEVKTTELTSGMLNMTNHNYADNKIKIAFATAEELEGGGDIAEIVCEALSAGSFEMELSELFMSREVTSKATSKKSVSEIEGITSASGIITVKDATQAQTEVHPLLSVEDAEVKAGDTFTLAVSIKNVEQWDSFELLVEYDNSIIEIESVEKTDITKDMLDMTNKEEGKIKLAFATAKELTENGEVAILKCKALKKGVCEIKLSQQLITGELEGNVVEIEGVMAVNAIVTVK